MRKEEKVQETKTIVTYYCDGCGKNLGKYSGFDCYGCGNTFCEKCKSKKLTYLYPAVSLCPNCIKNRSFMDNVKELQEQMNAEYKKFWKACKKKKKGLK
jgi:hypothetical protein